MSILIDRGENIERGKDASNHKVQVSNSKVPPGTDPMP